MKISSWFEPLIEHLWTLREAISTDDFVFDYPDYGGLPKKISSKLSSEMVDLIQEELEYWHESTTKREFKKVVADHLSRGIIV